MKNSELLRKQSFHQFFYFYKFIDHIELLLLILTCIILHLPNLSCFLLQPTQVITLKAKMSETRIKNKLQVRLKLMSSFALGKPGFMYQLNYE